MSALTKLSLIASLAAFFAGGCGLLGLDTPGERAFYAQSMQDEARDQANRDAQAAADKAKTDAETRAAEVAADILRKSEAGHDPVDLRMAARQLGFNKEVHRKYVNGVLVDDTASVVGKWKTPTGSSFDFSRQFCGIGSRADCTPGDSLTARHGDDWDGLDFDNEADFAVFIRDCQAVDGAWKALK